jgi:hypothetical protein
VSFLLSSQLQNIGGTRVRGNSSEGMRKLLTYPQLSNYTLKGLGIMQVTIYVKERSFWQRVRKFAKAHNMSVSIMIYYALCIYMAEAEKYE